MSFDPFVFTPPRLDDLNEAVEHAQKSAVVQAVRFVREDRRASSSEFAAAARNGRHLTAIQRTLRTMGGPLFDPDSPLTPAQRNEILLRRVARVEAAYADPLNAPASPLRCHTRTLGRSNSRSVSSFPPDSPEASEALTPETPSDCSASSSSRPSGPLDPSDPSRISNFKSEIPSSPDPLPTFDADYCPPDIEDLLSTAELLAKAAAQRWRDIREGRLFLTLQDRQLETLALRDITAIFRTLYRMSALAIAEDQTHEDLKKEREADFAIDPVAVPDIAPSTSSSDPSDSSDPSNSSDPSDPSDPSNPSDSSDPSDPSDSSNPSQVSNFKSEIPLPSDLSSYPSHPSSESYASPTDTDPSTFSNPSNASTQPPASQAPSESCESLPPSRKSCLVSSSPTISDSSNPSDSSHPSQVSNFKSEIPLPSDLSSYPSYPSSVSYASPTDTDPSTFSNPSNASTEPPASQAPFESCESLPPSRKSCPVSSSPSADEELPLPATNAIPPQRPVRPIPPVPEIRPVATSRRASSTPIPQSSSEGHGLPARDSNASKGRRHQTPKRSRKRRGRWSALYQEDDFGPWGIWDTPPPGSVDESAPEFLKDMKTHGYAEAHRRAADRMKSAAAFPPGSAGSSILNDSFPPKPPPPDDSS